MGVGRTTSTAVSLVALLVTAWLAIPTSLGGRTSYVTTHGVSMEPRFHTGDLAVVRSSQRYEVGDVAAYRSALLHTVVMHRIVKVEHGRYTFKGDNNNFLDPETPDRSRLIGKLALRVPQGGHWLRRLTSPAALAGVAFLAMTAGGAAVRGRRSRRRQRMSRHARPRSATAALAAYRPARGFAAVAAGAGLCAAVAAVAGWGAPTVQSVDGQVRSKQTVTFAYAAQVGRTPAYDGTEARSPDPVFRKLARTVDVDFRYRGAPGTVTVTAQLSAGSGWHASVPLSARVSFAGDRYDGQVRLDLAGLQRRVDAAAVATGVPAEGVRLAVVARFVTRHETPFAPQLPLKLSPLQLSLDGAPSALSVTRTSDHPATSRAPRTVGFEGHTVQAVTARVAAVALGLLALLAAGCAGLLRRPRAGSGAVLARRRYASLIVDVEPVTLPTGRPLVDVPALPALVRVAERYGLLITRSSRAGVDTYLVQDESATFRYRAGQGMATGSAVAPSTGSTPARPERAGF